MENYICGKVIFFLGVCFAVILEVFIVFVTLENFCLSSIKRLETLLRITTKHTSSSFLTLGYFKPFQAATWGHESFSHLYVLYGFCLEIFCIMSSI